MDLQTRRLISIDFKSYELREDPTYLTEISNRYQVLLEILLNRSEIHDVDPVLVSRFREIYSYSHHSCRFFQCQEAPNGFTTIEAPNEHESTHARVYRCRDLSCEFSNRDFGSKGALNSHDRKYHAKAVNNVLPIRQRRLQCHELRFRIKAVDKVPPSSERTLQRDKRQHQQGPLQNPMANTESQQPALTFDENSKGPQFSRILPAESSWPATEKTGSPFKTPKRKRSDIGHSLNERLAKRFPNREAITIDTGIDCLSDSEAKKLLLKGLPSGPNRSYAPESGVEGLTPQSHEPRCIENIPSTISDGLDNEFDGQNYPMERPQAVGKTMSTHIHPSDVFGQQGDQELNTQPQNFPPPPPPPPLDLQLESMQYQLLPNPPLPNSPPAVTRESSPAVPSRQNAALQDYQMQLMLIEQQTKRRLLPNEKNLLQVRLFSPQNQTKQILIQ
jgi:hypothetical protein